MRNLQIKEPEESRFHNLLSGWVEMFIGASASKRIDMLSLSLSEMF